MSSRLALRLKQAVLAGLAAAVLVGTAAQAEGEVNLYSSRHYDTDERLYSDFEKATGIKVNRIEDKAEALVARMEAEGKNSPADVLITVDAGNLWRAEAKGLLQPVKSTVLEEKIPAAYRHPEGLWFAFSNRARIIFFDKSKIDPKTVATYEDLAKPALKGQVCTRSSSNIYMLSLMASLIANDGETAAGDWAKSVYANRARDPEGGDTDQLKGIISGQCAVALSNHYYFVRLKTGGVKGVSEADAAKIGWVFPNQGGRGAHVNVSGAGVAVNAPNKENAVKFIEYLASPQAQAYFAAGNFEFPVVAGAELTEPVKSLGTFKADTLNVSELGKNQAKAQALYDAAGYK